MFKDRIAEPSNNYNQALLLPLYGLEPLSCHVIRVYLNSCLTDPVYTGPAIGPEDQSEYPGHNVTEFPAVTGVRKLNAVGTGLITLPDAA